MASCNSWQYLVTILAKNFPRSWQDLAKILLRYPWRVDPGPQDPLCYSHLIQFHRINFPGVFPGATSLKSLQSIQAFLVQNKGQ